MTTAGNYYVRLGPSTLYGAITRLDERGLIEPLAAEERRRPYRITAAGEAELTEAVVEMRRIADVGSQRLRGLRPTVGRAVGGAGA